MRDENRSSSVPSVNATLRVVLMAAAIWVMASTAGAQINPFGQRPRVPVTIRHPASLGITIMGKKVAFGPVTGSCPQEFNDLLMQDFVKQGVTLVNRTTFFSATEPVIVGSSETTRCGLRRRFRRS